MQSTKRSKSTTKTDRICGIYRITSSKQKGAYIGQSTNIYARWHHHKTDLEEGQHVNDRLRELYRLHGIKTLKFEVVEQCAKESLDDREIFWISKEGTWNETPNQATAQRRYQKITANHPATKSKSSKNSFQSLPFLVAVVLGAILGFFVFKSWPIALVVGVILGVWELCQRKT